MKLIGRQDIYVGETLTGLLMELAPISERYEGPVSEEERKAVMLSYLLDDLVPLAENIEVVAKHYPSLGIAIASYVCSLVNGKPAAWVHHKVKQVLAGDANHGLDVDENSVMSDLVEALDDVSEIPEYYPKDEYYKAISVGQLDVDDALLATALFYRDGEWPWRLPTEERKSYMEIMRSVNPTSVMLERSVMLAEAIAFRDHYTKPKVSMVELHEVYTNIRETTPEKMKAIYDGGVEPSDVTLAQYQRVLEAYDPHYHYIDDRQSYNAAERVANALAKLKDEVERFAGAAKVKTSLGELMGDGYTTDNINVKFDGKLLRRVKAVKYYMARITEYTDTVAAGKPRTWYAYTKFHVHGKPLCLPTEIQEMVRLVVLNLEHLDSKLMSQDMHRLFHVDDDCYHNFRLHIRFR